jgi:hypothetical protein
MESANIAMKVIFNGFDGKYPYTDSEIGQVSRVQVVAAADCSALVAG